MRKFSIAMMCMVLALGLTGCPKAELTVSPADLTISLLADDVETADVDESAVNTGEVTVGNTGKAALNWTAESDIEGVVLDVASGTIEKGGDDVVITVTATRADITAEADADGNVTGTITVSVAEEDKADEEGEAEGEEEVEEDANVKTVAVTINLSEVAAEGEVTE